MLGYHDEFLIDGHGLDIPRKGYRFREVLQTVKEVVNDSSAADHNDRRFGKVKQPLFSSHKIVKNGFPELMDIL